jgi:hypothetical protein
MLIITFWNFTHIFFKVLLWFMSYQKMPICYQWQQGYYMFKTCQWEECLNKFAKDDHMDKKINKRKAWVWKCMCWIKWVATLKIKKLWWRLYLLVKWSCLNRHWTSKRPLFCVLGYQAQCFYDKKLLKSEVW